MAWTGRGGKRIGGLADLPGACPMTWAVIGINILTFLAPFLGVRALREGLIFDPGMFLARPWTAITYPLVAGGNIVTFLLAAYVFWLFSGSLERSWGGRDYLVFLVLITLAPGLALWVAGILIAQSPPLVGLWVPASATVVAWAVLNPYERVLVYFVIPLEARWLGLLAVALVLFSFGFPFGLFAIAGCGVAYWYARGGKYRFWSLGRGGGTAQKPSARPRRFSLNPLEAIQRWRRKRQFARLLKRSGLRDLDS